MKRAGKKKEVRRRKQKKLIERLNEYVNSSASTCTCLLRVDHLSTRLFPALHHVNHEMFVLYRSVCILL